MTTIAFITTCKGRLHHLRQTLPLFAAQGADQIVVVDYNCPDRVGEWVEANHPGVQVARVRDETHGFNLARARNAGAKLATADWLVFIDADIKTAPGWVDWMRRELRPGHFYRVGKIDGTIDGQTAGTVICARSDFEALEGYDEVIDGWGGEDFDLYDRLLEHGVTLSRYPGESVTAIHHGTEERAGWDGMADSRQKYLLERCYRTMKAHVTKALGAPLSLETRQSIRNETRRCILKWYADGVAKPLTMRFASPGMTPVRLPGDNLVSAELSLTIRVERQPPPEGTQ